jgi:hypothetical protein
MRDRGGVALALEADLGVVDRARGIRQQDQLEIDRFGILRSGRRGAGADEKGRRPDDLSHRHPSMIAQVRSA